MPPAVPSLDTIADEVKAGLPGSRGRRDAARANRDFYELRNASYIERRESEDVADYGRRPKRTSKLTRKAVRTLTSQLYRPGPARDVEGGGAAADFLAALWESSHINALMQAADREATLNDCCAIQAVASGRDEGQDTSPLKLYLWHAHEFEPFFSDDDPLTPWAVCTVSCIQKDGKARRKYELWSAQEHRVYTTKPVDITTWHDAGAQGIRAEYRPELSGYQDEGGDWQPGQNPYGVLPFSFVWNELPVSDFWGSGIGSALRDCNQEIDRELSDLAEGLQKFTLPRWFLRNVSTSFRWKDQPGRPAHLPPSTPAEDGGPPPEVFAAQATVAVQDVWYNSEKYANQTFYELDVPLSAVRDDTNGPSSGLQVVAERAPLVDYTEGRREPFRLYETALARTCCRVAGTYYGRPELATAADMLTLRLDWLDPKPATGGPEVDASDQFELDQGLASEIDVLARRRGLTIEQATEAFREIVERRKLVQTLTADLQPKPDPAHPTDPTNPDAGAEPDPTDPSEGTADDAE